MTKESIPARRPSRKSWRLISGSHKADLSNLQLSNKLSGTVIASVALMGTASFAWESRRFTLQKDCPKRLPSSRIGMASLSCGPALTANQLYNHTMCPSSVISSSSSRFFTSQKLTPDNIIRSATQPTDLPSPPGAPEASTPAMLLPTAARQSLQTSADQLC